MASIQNIQEEAKPVATTGNTNQLLYAENSKYYGKVMCDGHIFNPYLDRRFLPVQFLRLMKKFDMNVHKAITETYSYEYSLKWVVSEVKKLAQLEKYDKATFMERSFFLTLDDVKNIISDHVARCEEILTSYELHDSKLGEYSKELITGLLRRLLCQMQIIP